MTFEERTEERRKRMVAHKAGNHQEAEEWDLAYWQSKSPEERLSALVAIRNDVEKVIQSRLRAIPTNEAGPANGSH